MSPTQRKKRSTKRAWIRRLKALVSVRHTDRVIWFDPEKSVRYRLTEESMRSETARQLIDSIKNF
jgi:hypothetical protein